MQTEIIAKLIQHVKDNCNRIDAEARYNEMLDEVYSLESVGGPFANMSASRVLEEVDPVAYRCGMNDWVDGEGWLEIDGDNYDADEVEKARDEFLDSLTSEETDLEVEIEAAEKDEDYDTGKLAIMKQELAEIQADYTAAKQYTF